MEEELNYSALVFKNDNPLPPKDIKEDPPVYSEVKPKHTAAAAPVQADGEAAATSHSRLLLVCLGILCVLLVASIITIISIGVVMVKVNANLSDLRAENEQLIVDMRRERDSYNWTMGVILKYDNFPVNQFCPNKKCQPCLDDWVLFQDRCYLFHNESAPWMTWDESQKCCQDKGADLVVIDDLQEQEFISAHIEYYYRKSHGYWFGLHETGRNWIWIDGRIDTLRYWMKQPVNPSGSCALMIPDKKTTESWDDADCKMRNKFICERDVLIRTKQD